MTIAKKIALLLFAVFMLAACMCASAEEAPLATGKCGKSITWTLSSDGTLYIDGTGEMYGDTDNSTSICGEYTESVKHAVISEGITSIGIDSFSRCTNLISVDIPESCESIGTYAFCYCSSLTSVDIPEGCKEIGYYAFYRCTSLSSVSIPEGCETIGNGAFWACSSLTSINIPASITFIDSDAFADCHALTTTYAASLESWMDIEFGSLASNPMVYADSIYINGRYITGLTIPHGVTTINNYTFYRWSQLTDINIPDSVISIGENALAGCGISSLYLPDSVTTIGIGAFSGCSSMADIRLSPSISEIPENAFFGCHELESIVIPEGVTSLGSDAFLECYNLKYVTLPESLTSISSSFRYCTALEYISIPSGVTYIDAAFECCANLKAVDFQPGLTVLGGSIFSSCTSLARVTLPDTLEKISFGCFGSCEALKSITIPASVTIIGDLAFSTCSNLSKIVFLGDTMPTLGEGVFPNDCTIYCKEFSEAEFWAMDNNYTVEYIDSMDLTVAQSLYIDDSFNTFNVGDKKYLSVSVFPQQPAENIVWTSSAPEVVSVDSGMITVLAAGEAVITASCGEVSDSLTITAYAPIKGFELSDTEIWLVSKEQAELFVCNITPAGATGEFVWGCSDSSVVSIAANNAITARVPGDAVVTVTSDSGVTRECIVHVFYPVTAIDFEPGSHTAEKYGKIQLTANVTARTQSVVNKLVTFESSDENIAAVDENGLVSANSPGLAVITATSASGISAECKVLVYSDERLYLPDSTVDIGAEAFAGTDTESAVLPDGCTTIGSRAFADCAGLISIYMPNSVADIAADAFENSPGVCFVCESENAAAEFAESHGIEYIIK